MSLKQRTYEGYGMQDLLDTCKRHNITKENSDLTVKDTNDPNSYWIVKVKPGFLHTTK